MANASPSDILKNVTCISTTSVQPLDDDYFTRPVDLTQGALPCLCYDAVCVELQWKLPPFGGHVTLDCNGYDVYTILFYTKHKEFDDLFCRACCFYCAFVLDLTGSYEHSRVVQVAVVSICGRGLNHRLYGQTSIPPLSVPDT